MKKAQDFIYQGVFATGELHHISYIYQGNYEHEYINLTHKHKVTKPSISPMWGLGAVIKQFLNSLNQKHNYIKSRNE
jgi:hypothetical protein